MADTAMATATPLSSKERHRLRLIRLERGWSFSKMASAIGLTESTLKNVIRNEDLQPLDTTTYRIRQWLRSEVSR